MSKIQLQQINFSGSVNVSASVIYGVANPIYSSSAVPASWVTEQITSSSGDITGFSASISQRVDLVELTASALFEEYSGSRWEPVSGINTSDAPYNYGNLYNAYAVLTGVLNVDGYRIPSKTDFDNLVSYIGGDILGYTLKSERTSPSSHPRWDVGFTGTDLYGFNSLPSGYRNDYGPFSQVGKNTRYWTSTPYSATRTWSFELDSNSNVISDLDIDNRSGYCVRCMRDATAEEQSLADGTVVDYPADIDGNLYTAIKIGTQVWFKQNLKTTKYNNGTNITNITVELTWALATTEGYCTYNNNPLSTYEDATYTYEVQEIIVDGGLYIKPKNDKKVQSDYIHVTGSKGEILYHYSGSISSSANLYYDKDTYTGVLLGTDNSIVTANNVTNSYIIASSGSIITNGATRNRIIGGSYHTITNSSTDNEIIGGTLHTISAGGVIRDIFIGGSGSVDTDGGGSDNVIIGGATNIMNSGPRFRSVIIGGESNILTHGGGNNNAIIASSGSGLRGNPRNQSVIIGGSSNIINSTTGVIENTVILGGNNIIATASNTAYVQHFNLNGYQINTISNDVTLSGSSDTALVTEYAVKNAIDSGSTWEVEDEVFVRPKSDRFVKTDYIKTNDTENQILFAGSGSIVTSSQYLKWYDSPETGYNKILLLGGDNSYPNASSSERVTIIAGSGSMIFEGGAIDSAIVAGTHNFLRGSTNYRSVIIGGESNNLIGGGNTNSAIIASSGSNMVNATISQTVIIGGSAHLITDAGGVNSIIIGGNTNVLRGNGGVNTVLLGGCDNTIQAGGAVNSAIIASSGSYTNGGTIYQSLIIGGTGNTLRGGIVNSAIIGGHDVLGTESNTVYLPNVIITGSAIINGVNASNFVRKDSSVIQYINNDISIQNNLQVSGAVYTDEILGDSTGVGIYADTLSNPVAYLDRQDTEFYSQHFDFYNTSSVAFISMDNITGIDIWKPTSVKNGITIEKGTTVTGSYNQLGDSITIGNKTITGSLYITNSATINSELVATQNFAVAMAIALG